MMRRKDFLKKFYIPKDFSHLLDPVGKPLTKEETAFVACYDRREFMKKTSKALIWLAGAGIMSQLWKPKPLYGARLFNGSTEGLLVSAGLITAYPFTISAWTRLDVLPSVKGDEEVVFELQQNNNSDNFWNLRLDDGSTNKLQFNARASAGTTQVAQTSNTIVVDTWSHVFASGVSATDRTNILNGDVSSKGTSTGSSTPVSIQRTSIGYAQAGTTDFLDGRIAEVFLWDAALTDNEGASLSNGVSPYRVRPGNIIHHWPLYGRNNPEPNFVGTSDMTFVNSPSQADHSPGMPTFALSNEESFQTAAAAEAAVERRRLIKTN